MYLLKEDAESSSTLEKLSSIRETLTPEHFAHVLERFDSGTGLKRYWGKDIEDPYYSVFNIEKIAAGFARPSATISFGAETVSESALLNLAKNPQLISKNFGNEVANSFMKEPIKIFQSMPLPQKKFIARLAEDSIGNF